MGMASMTSSAREVAPGYRSLLEQKINTMPNIKRSRSETQLGFNGGCVGSSMGFVTIAGNMLAIPHRTGGKSWAPPDVRLEGGSEYMRQFSEKPYCYSSMDRKPLTTYDPLHYRSRNMTPDVLMPYKNASVVNFHGGMLG